MIHAVVFLNATTHIVQPDTIVEQVLFYTADASRNKFEESLCHAYL